MTAERREIKRVDWEAEGRSLFGDDKMKWRFVCPVCKHVATPQDWITAGANPGSIAFSCVGRNIEGVKAAFDDKGKGPCTYAGGGLFRLNPVTVIDDSGAKHEMFEFDRSAVPA